MNEAEAARLTTVHNNKERRPTVAQLFYHGAERKEAISTAKRYKLIETSSDYYIL